MLLLPSVQMIVSWRGRGAMSAILKLRHEDPTVPASEGSVISDIGPCLDMGDFSTPPSASTKPHAFGGVLVVESRISGVGWIYGQIEERV
jgi:hypothetical protein